MILVNIFRALLYVLFNYRPEEEQNNIIVYQEKTIYQKEIDKVKEKIND